MILATNASLPPAGGQDIAAGVFIEKGSDCLDTPRRTLQVVETKLEEPAAIVRFFPRALQHCLRPVETESNTDSGIGEPPAHFLR